MWLASVTLKHEGHIEKTIDSECYTEHSLHIQPFILTKFVNVFYRDHKNINKFDLSKQEIYQFT